MWNAVDRPFHKIFYREECTLLSELTAQYGAPKNRQYFDVQQLRSEQSCVFNEAGDLQT